MKKIIMTVLISFLSAAALSAGGAGEAAVSGGGDKSETVIASSTWTAAFIRASGWEGEITPLAPADYRHPSEYELLPSQVAALHDADYFVYAGYEAVAKRVEEGSLRTGGTNVQIQTVNTSKVIEESLAKLSQILGDPEAARRNTEELTAYIHETRELIAEAGYSGAPVVCHRFLEGMAREMGFSIAGTFGPAPPSPSQLKTLSEASPALILDNWHVDTGKAVAAVLPDVPRALFINFPGHEETETLKDVLAFNRKAVLSALEQ